MGLGVEGHERTVRTRPRVLLAAPTPPGSPGSRGPVPTRRPTSPRVSPSGLLVPSSFCLSASGFITPGTGGSDHELRKECKETISVRVAPKQEPHKQAKKA